MYISKYQCIAIIFFQFILVFLKLIVTLHYGFFSVKF